MKNLFELLCTANGAQQLFDVRRLYRATNINGMLCGNKILRRSGYQDIINGIKYSAAIYRPGYIAFMELENNSDAISFDFSGCYMAVFEIGHQKFVAHIEKMGYEREGDNSPVNEWNSLVKGGLIRNISLFKPSEYFTNKKNNGVWGIITSDRYCYAINTFECPADNFCFLYPDGISRAYPQKSPIIPCR